MSFTMELPNLKSIQELYQNRAQYKKIFFWRICGTGMGSGATLLREAGYHIEGCDKAFYPPMSTYLESTGIPLHIMDQLKADFLKTFDLIVIGNVVPREGEMAGRFIEELGVPFASLPDTLSAFVLKDRNVVGLAGTHGKTTTTYLITQVFENLGLKPGYLIGGVLEDRPSSALGKNSYFFIEADEYDTAYFQKVSKFRQYSLKHMILTSLEYDHADIFPSLEKIEEQFKLGIPDITQSFLFSADYPSSTKLEETYKNIFTERRWSLYGENSAIGPHRIHMEPQGSQFTLKLGGTEEVFQTNLIGKQNILNLSAAVIFAFQEGFKLEDIKRAILKLRMVKRRQEVRGTYKGALVIDDFAHHPRAVTLTIESIRATYPDKKILTVFEPNSWTARSNIFQKEFAESLSYADKIIATLPNRKSHIQSAGQMDCEQLVSDINRLKHNQAALIAANLTELRAVLEQNAQEGNLFLILSNGTCLGLWESDFVSQLKKN